MWFNKSDKELEQEFKSNLNVGLSSKQVEERLVKNGKNELPKPKNKHWILIFLVSLFSFIIKSIISYFNYCRSYFGYYWKSC